MFPAILTDIGSIKIIKKLKHSDWDIKGSV
jgi:hypothetical protein